MNRDDIIRMAKQASGSEWSIFQDFMPELERFATLVVEENDKKWQALIAKIDEYAAACNKGIELSGKLSLAAIDVAVTVEREACARVCEAEREEWGGDTEGALAARDCANAIRARGEE